jgi:hypothetical protein
METALGKDVLLVERFDRENLKGGWGRKAFVCWLKSFGAAFKTLGKAFASYLEG